MMFKRLDNYLVDIEHSTVIDTDKGIILKFDLNDMTMRKVISTTKGGGTPTPIKYSEDSGGLVYWKTNRWMPFGTSDDAVQFLFNSKIEKAVLG